MYIIYIPQLVEKHSSDIFLDWPRNVRSYMLLVFGLRNTRSDMFLGFGPKNVRSDMFLGFDRGT
jgi:hypothetical protein